MSNSTSGGGIGFCGALFIAFLVMKLCNVITWSWWWIFAPLWGPCAIFLAFAVVIFIVAILVAILASIFK